MVLATIEEVLFAAEGGQQLYVWVVQVSAGRKYAQPGNAARGMVTRYMEEMTLLSLAQMRRLIATRTFMPVCRTTVGCQKLIAKGPVAIMHRIAQSARPVDS